VHPPLVGAPVSFRHAQLERGNRNPHVQGAAQHGQSGERITNTGRNHNQIYSHNFHNLSSAPVKMRAPSDVATQINMQKSEILELSGNIKTLTLRVKELNQEIEQLTMILKSQSTQNRAKAPYQGRSVADRLPPVAPAHSAAVHSATAWPPQTPAPPSPA